MTVKDIGVELGIGRGFTSGSDPLIVKVIIDYPFPVPGKKTDSDKHAKRRTGNGNVATRIANRFAREVMA
jgi:hypothetical protein